MHNRASLKGILWLPEVLKWVAAKTGTITRPSSFISWPLHFINWIYSLLNRAKPGSGGIIAQSRLNFSILEWCLRKDVTQSIKWLHIPKSTVWRELGMILVIREIHFIFRKTPSEVPTALFSRYCLPSCLSISSHWVGSFIFRCMADSLLIATKMNSLLWMIISELRPQCNGAGWLNASECFGSSQLSMHRWQNNIAAYDRPHKA